MLTPLISKRLLYGETSNPERPIPAKTKLFCFSSKSVLSSPMEINTTGIIRINYSQKMTRLSSNSCLISSSLGVASGLFFKTPTIIEIGMAIKNTIKKQYPNMVNALMWIQKAKFNVLSRMMKITSFN
jgi:hypothetical protein